jgi:hypothetical protein
MHRRRSSIVEEGAMRGRVAVALWVLACASASCGNGSNGGTSGDAGGPDAADGEVPSDSSAADAPMPTDASVTDAQDATVDASDGGGTDAHPHDATADVGIDVAADARSDAALDATTDVAIDAPSDACAKGIACTPTNPCDLGVVDCSDGGCVDTGNPNTQANGTACGTNAVCDDGACNPCTAGVTCTPADPCHLGSTSCATGTSVCVDTGNPDTGADGNACGSSGVCCAGACVGQAGTPQACTVSLAGVFYGVAAVAGTYPDQYVTDIDDSTCLKDYGLLGGAVVPVNIGLGAPFACGMTGPGGLVTSPGATWSSGKLFWLDRSTPVDGGATTTIGSHDFFLGSSPTLGTVPGTALAIASDATTPYWTMTDGTVMSLPTGGPARTLASGGTSPIGIAADSSYVYWADQALGTVMRVANGGGSAPVTIASGQSGPTGVAVDATYVYWTNYNGGTVMRAPIGGGSAPTTIASGLQEPLSIAVDGSGIYWTTLKSTGGPGPGPETVMMAPLCGGTPTTLVAGCYAWSIPQAIALDPGNVYWISGSGFASTPKR